MRAFGQDGVLAHPIVGVIWNGTNWWGGSAFVADSENAPGRGRYMRLLELVGSLALFVYIVTVVFLTSVNLSKFLFALHRERESHFWARQTTIFLWPLIIISREGREALAIIWQREDLEGEDE
jgi:hypothetical protein